MKKNLTCDKVPRKLKKAIKNSILILDIVSIPRGLDLESWYKIFQSTGLILHDSDKGGITPHFAKRKYKRVKVIDVTSNKNIL